MANRLGAFEMRRLEALSNTIFGVAMTLLAYDLPKQKLMVATPDWHAIAAVYGTNLLALLLSFVIAGMFWFSHQRRRRLQAGQFEQRAIGTRKLRFDEAARIGGRADEITGSAAAGAEAEAIERHKRHLRIAGHRNSSAFARHGIDV